LHGSDRGPVERIKHEYYVLLAAVVAELELLTAAMAGKLEVWGGIADFERLGPIALCGNDAPRESTSSGAAPFYACQ
jgi:hypothetical protein